MEDTVRKYFYVYEEHYNNADKDYYVECLFTKALGEYLHEYDITIPYYSGEVYIYLDENSTRQIGFLSNDAKKDIIAFENGKDFSYFEGKEYYIELDRAFAEKAGLA